MTLKKIHLESFDGYDTPIEELKEFENKYYFWIDGYSLSKNTAFIIFEIGIGNDEIDAIHNAYDKVFNRLNIRYHMHIDEMKIKESKLLSHNETMKRYGHIFYPLTMELIMEFKEDEERYLMSIEDKN